MWFNLKTLPSPCCEKPSSDDDCIVGTDMLSEKDVVPAYCWIPVLSPDTLPPVTDADDDVAVVLVPAEDLD
jgi:hypothetical protein